MSDKFAALVQALKDVDLDIGLYPAAIKGFNDERDYEQRDGYKNGFNAAVMEIVKKYAAIIEQAQQGISDDLTMLLAADVGYLRDDGTLMLNFNDVWGWACSDGEAVSPAELPEVASLYRAWGWAGLLYWCSEKRGGQVSEFRDNNRFIEFVRREQALIKAVPDSNKRAYMADADMAQAIESSGVSPRPIDRP